MDKLAQYQDKVEVKQVLDNIRSTPDFALVSQDKKRVFIVESKFCTKFRNSEVKRIVEKTLKFATPTPDGFFFDACNNVFNHEGDINRLLGKWISKNIQDKYLNLLREFEK